MLELFKIVGLCVVVAVLYGIAHDQVTARVCVEYFTIGHPTVIHSTSPTLLALVWGVIATWWFGLLLGLPLAVVARVGSLPKLGVTHVVKPLAILMLVIASCSLVAGCLGWWAAEWKLIVLLGPMADDVPPDRHVPFLADLCAHNVAYATGAIGALVIWVWTLAQRWKARRLESRGMSHVAIR